MVIQPSWLMAFSHYPFSKELAMAFASKLFLFGLLATLLSGSTLMAAPPTNETVIQVEKMCCQGCVQKIAAQLYTVRGVKEVRYDLEKKIVVVVPQSQATLSPLAMWNAVIKGKDRPLRIAGPTGVFTEKPRY